MNCGIITLFYHTDAKLELKTNMFSEIMLKLCTQGPRVLGRTGLVSAWGAKGPGPDRLGFGLGGQGSWAGPARVWLGGQGSWAGPAWFWLGGPRVLGRAGLVLNTWKDHDSDEDVNIILRRSMTVMGMLI